mgnify:CR=1 FL=1
MSFRRVFALAGLLALGAAQAETAAEVKPGDAKAGEVKAAVCGACHGPDGNSATSQYPKLAGQHEAYIARQLGLFKGAKRQNPIMLGFAAALSEQDMHDLGAYFSTKQIKPGVADEKLVARGAQLYRAGDAKLGVPACMSCHGPTGRGNSAAGYPQVGGQWADYVGTKLKDWQSGTQWSDDERAGIMPAIAKRLTVDDIAALASYLEGLHGNEAGAAAKAE